MSRTDKTVPDVCWCQMCPSSGARFPGERVWLRYSVDQYAYYYDTGTDCMERKPNDQTRSDQGNATWEQGGTG